MRYILRSLALTIISIPHFAHANQQDSLEEAIFRCEAWMSSMDDMILSSDWTLSHINVVPNTSGGAGEITKEFHHPDLKIVLQSSHRPASGNRSCSVISNVTAFNNLADTALAPVSSGLAIETIDRWVEQAKKGEGYQIIEPEGLFDQSLLNCSSIANFTVGVIILDTSVSDYLPWMVAFGKDHQTDQMCE